MRKYPSLLFAILLSIIALLVRYSYPAKPDGAVPVEVVTGSFHKSDSAPARIGQASDGVPDAPVEKSDDAIALDKRTFVARVWAAKDAATALSLIRLAQSQGLAEANDAWLELDGLCVHSLYPQGGAIQWFDDWLANYCTGYRSIDKKDGAVALLAIAQQGVQVKMRAFLESKSAGLENDQKVGLLKDALVRSQSPYEVRAALEFAAFNGVSLLPDTAISRSSPHFQRDVLGLAAELAYCRLSNTCGVGNYNTARACIAASICRQGASFTDVLREMYPPVQYRAAEAFVDQLLISRNRGPGG